MSYINTHAALAPAGGIQELSFDEIEEVEGAGWVTRGVYVALVVVGVSSGVALVAGLAVGIGVAYYNSRADYHPKEK